MNDGDIRGAVAGRIVLPASFTGGTRYMVTRLNDTMALVREFGGGDLLVTITCNQFWPYIVVFQYDKVQRLSSLFSRLFASSRPSLMCRSFASDSRPRGCRPRRFTSSKIVSK